FAAAIGNPCTGSRRNVVQENSFAKRLTEVRNIGILLYCRNCIQAVFRTADRFFVPCIFIKKCQKLTSNPAVKLNFLELYPSRSKYSLSVMFFKSINSLKVFLNLYSPYTSTVA